jgi:hypothetical protein
MAAPSRASAAGPPFRIFSGCSDRAAVPELQRLQRPPRVFVAQDHR